MNDLEKFRDVFASIRPWQGVVAAGYDVDFLGMMTRVDYLPPARRSPRCGEARYCTPLPPELGTSANAAEAERWFEVIDWVISASEARDRYVMITLGANYGAQAVGARLALSQINSLPYKLVAIEPEPANIDRLRQHLIDNGIDPGQQWILPLAISDSATPVYFPFIGVCNGSQNCYSTNHPEARRAYVDMLVESGQVEEALRNLILRNTTGLMREIPKGSGRQAEIKLLSCITLADVLAPFERVDYIESDIQESEILVFPPFLDLLRRKVRRIHIGTHGALVHARLHELFEGTGWRIVFSYAPESRFDSALGDFATNDGVLTIRNPDI